MAYNKTEICNLALSNIEVSKFLANIDAERSNEALACKRWYDHAVKYTLEDFDWNFARRRRALALLDTDPPSNWTYVYAVPSDCAAVRSIELAGYRTPYAEQRIPFEVAAETRASGADPKVIYTDLANPVLVYTKLITDAGMFDAHYVEALAAYLASKISSPLRADIKLAGTWFQMYQGLRINAYAFHLNAGQEDAEPISETERTRNS